MLSPPLSLLLPLSPSINLFFFSAGFFSPLAAKEVLVTLGRLLKTVVIITIIIIFIYLKNEAFLSLPSNSFTMSLVETRVIAQWGGCMFILHAVDWGLIHSTP